MGAATLEFKTIGSSKKIVVRILLCFLWYWTIYTISPSIPNFYYLCLNADLKMRQNDKKPFSNTSFTSTGRGAQSLWRSAIFQKYLISQLINNTSSYQIVLDVLFCVRMSTAFIILSSDLTFHIIRTEIILITPAIHLHQTWIHFLKYNYYWKAFSYYVDICDIFDSYSL